MHEFEKQKYMVISQLRGLCAHCANGRVHNCPIKPLAIRIQAIRGVPLMVNNEFKGVLWR